MSGFMQHQVTVEMEWWKVDGREGTDFFPCDDFTASQAAEAYEFPQAIDTIERVTGFGARLSAPGYMDCTEWSVFDTEAEAVAYLADTFQEDEDAAEAPAPDIDEDGYRDTPDFDPSDRGESYRMAE